MSEISDNSEMINAQDLDFSSDYEDSLNYPGKVGENLDYLEEPISIDLDCVKMEMDDIQSDLQDLVSSLNALVADGNESGINTDLGEANETLEKLMESIKEDENLSSFIINDKSNKNFKSINWDKFGPFVDNIVADLHKLKSLNSRTNDVVRRIRNISVVGHLGSTGSLIITDNNNNNNSKPQ